MVDQNSPLINQLRAAGVNAGNEGRDYWERLFSQAAYEIERLRTLIEIGRVTCEECGALATHPRDGWAYCVSCVSNQEDQI